MAAASTYGCYIDSRCDMVINSMGFHMKDLTEL